MDKSIHCKWASTNSIQAISETSAVVNEQSLMLLANIEGLLIQLNIKKKKPNIELAFSQAIAEATELSLVPQPLGETVLN